MLVCLAAWNAAFCLALLAIPFSSWWMNHCAHAHSPISVKHKETLLDRPNLRFFHNGPLKRFVYLQCIRSVQQPSCRSSGRYYLSSQTRHSTFVQCVSVLHCCKLYLCLLLWCYSIWIDRSRDDDDRSHDDHRSNKTKQFCMVRRNEKEGRFIYLYNALCTICLLLFYVCI